MSQESVEALKAVYSKWGTGEFWTPEIFDPDVELSWAEELCIEGFIDQRRARQALGLSE